MGRGGRAALGRFVMRTKEYLAALWVRDGALTITTMRFHDEVRPAGTVPAGGKKPTKKALDNAIAVIEELSTDWDPERYRLLSRAPAAADRGQAQAAEIEVPEPRSQPSPAPDLMAALERTLANARAGKDIRADEDGERDEPAKAESKRG